VTGPGLATCGPTRPSAGRCSLRCRSGASGGRRRSPTRAYLVSDFSAYVTGEALTIDGGAWLEKGIFGFGKEE